MTINGALLRDLIRTSSQLVADDNATQNRVTAVTILRGISDDPVLLGRASAHRLAAFLADPVTNPHGLQAAALLDAAGAAGAVQALIVEALNVRTRLVLPQQERVRTASPQDDGTNPIPQR